MYRSKDTKITSRLNKLFGENVVLTPLSSPDCMGRRMSGIDLRRDLSLEEAELLIDLLDAYQVITFPDQDHNSFRVAHLERIANHFGAPIPHPKNYANYVEYHTQGIASSRGPASQ
jgi:alpha-ketoglutarate-dependent taurine dioxygenase